MLGSNGILFVSAFWLIVTSQDVRIRRLFAGDWCYFQNEHNTFYIFLSFSPGRKTKFVENS